MKTKYRHRNYKLSCLGEGEGNWIKKVAKVALENTESKFMTPVM